MPSTSIAASLIVVLALEPTPTPVDAPEVAPSFLVPDMPDPNDPAWTAPLPPPPPPEPAPVSEVPRSPGPAAAPGSTRATSSSPKITPSAASSSPPASPSPPVAPRRVDRRKLTTAGLVTTGVGLGLGVVAYQADRRVDALAGSIRAQDALGTPEGESESERLERDLKRQRITLLTASIGAGVLGVTGLTLLAIALFRRGSPSLTHRAPRLRPAPAFVLEF